LVGLAGPGANLLMAILWAGVAKLSHLIFSMPSLHESLRQVALFFHMTSRFGIMINCVLLVINLIPIPPLDGSRLVSSLLPPPLAKKYEKLEWYGLWIFLGLIILLVVTNTTGLIWAPINALIQWIYILFGLPMNI
jgi:Zn-dependent protease